MPKIIIIGGPTASGKSQFAVNIAKESDCVIINADSQQIYQQIPILTAQPTQATQGDIAHYLYGFLDARQSYSVGKWLADVTKIIDDTIKAGKTPIIVGGTGMYLKCLIEGVADIPDIEPKIRQSARDLIIEMGNIEFHKMLRNKDPIMGEKLHSGDTQRMVRAWEIYQQTGQSIAYLQEHTRKIYYSAEIFEKHIIIPEREELYQNCNSRFQWMIENGAINEVKTLIAQGLDPQLPAIKALGIAEITAYLQGKHDLSRAIKQAQQATRRYAKRQVTWFRNQI